LTAFRGFEVIRICQLRVGAAVILQIETAAVSSFSIAVDAIWRFAMRPKELNDCGQTSLFCARLDQMAWILDRHPVPIGRLQPKITLPYCKTATSDAKLWLP
jgi:hypothetical protein